MSRRDSSESHSYDERIDPFKLDEKPKRKFKDEKQAKVEADDETAVTSGPRRRRKGKRS